MYGKADELSAVSSPTIEKIDSLCFDFWFDVKASILLGNLIYWQISAGRFRNQVFDD